MYKIITCMKYVPDTIEKNMATPTINRNTTQGKINPLDLNAIEESVRIKEKYGANIIGLCMGVEKAKDPVKYGIAMGLDEIYLLSDSLFAGSDTYVTSYILSKAIRTIGMADVILCGNQTSDGSTGQVPQELAIHLGLPCIINVVSIEIISERCIRCTVATEEDYINVEVALPAVISVLKDINEPRVPSIKGILKAQNAIVKVLNHEDIQLSCNECGQEASCTQIIKICQYGHKEKKTVDITSSYCEIIEKLLSDVALTHIVQFSKEINRHRPLANNRNNKEKEIWVICEKINEHCISDTAFQLLSKALSIAGTAFIVCAVILDRCSFDLLEQLVEYGVDKIYKCDAQSKVAIFDENRLLRLINLCKKHNPDIVLFENSTQGRWLAASVAASLQTGLTADCIDIKIDAQTGDLIQTRIAFSGNIMADIVCGYHRPQMATIRNNVFDAIPFSRSPFVTLIDIDDDIMVHQRIFPSEKKVKRESSGNLRKSDVIVCGGRGLGGKEGFELLNQFAKLIGASVGATRVAVDAKWIDYSHQIGQTGKTVKPKVYIAFGVSGAIEHMVGMDGADCVISINNDINAPINNISDYIILDDSKKVLNTLIGYYKKRKGDE